VTSKIKDSMAEPAAPTTSAPEKRSILGLPSRKS